MKNQGYNPNQLSDRKKYAETNNLIEELKLIPHYWNEYQGKIIDFTGKAQFIDTGLSSDLNKDRYIRG